MAFAHITVLRPIDDTETTSILAAVHESLVESLQVPTDDPRVWMTKPATHLVHPASQNRPTILIEVTMFAGRAPQTKQRLHEELAKKLQAAGTPREDVVVVMHEPPRENWGIAGVPSDQVDLGFRVDI